MRSDLDEDILIGQAVPGTGSSYLKRIRDVLTDELDNSVASWKDPLAFGRFKQIQEDYLKNSKAFENHPIAKLFLEPSQAARMGDEQIMLSAMNDPKVWDAFSQFFSPSSEAMRTLRRSVADRVMYHSRSPVDGAVSGTVDAGLLSKNMRQLFSDNPDMARSVFGEQGEILANLSEAIGRRIQDPTVRLGDLEPLLARGGKPSIDAINDIAKRHQDYVGQIRNKIKKSVAEGNPIPDISPQEMVPRLLRDNNFSNSEVREIMDLIRRTDPALHNQVQIAARMDIFLQSGKTRNVADNPAVLRHELPEMSVPGLRQQLGLEPSKIGDVQYNKERVAMVVGEEAYDQMINLTKLLSPRQLREEVSPLGGALASGAMSGMIQRHEYKRYGITAIRAYIHAAALQNPATARYMANNALDEAKMALILPMVAVGVPPMVEGINIFGDDWMESNYRTLNEWLGGVIEDSIQPGALQQSREEAFSIPRPEPGHFRR
jgi:hypothetical protein